MNRIFIIRFFLIMGLIWLIILTSSSIFPLIISSNELPFGAIVFLIVNILGVLFFTIYFILEKFMKKYGRKKHSKKRNI